MLLNLHQGADQAKLTEWRDKMMEELTKEK